MRPDAVDFVREAARLVPHAIGEKTNLLGTPAMIRERIRRYRDAGVSTLLLKLAGPLPARLTALAQTIELTAEVNRERMGGSPEHFGARMAL